jgi:hypothetical protein
MVSASKTGVILYREDISDENIKDRFEKLNDTEINKNSIKFSKIFQKLDGLKIAMDVIHDSIEIGNDHLVTGYYYLKYFYFFKFSWFEFYNLDIFFIFFFVFIIFLKILIFK